MTGSDLARSLIDAAAEAVDDGGSLGLDRTTVGDEPMRRVLARDAVVAVLETLAAAYSPGRDVYGELHQSVNVGVLLGLGVEVKEGR